MITDLGIVEQMMHDSCGRKMKISLNKKETESIFSSQNKIRNQISLLRNIIFLGETKVSKESATLAIAKVLLPSPTGESTPHPIKFFSSLAATKLMMQLSMIEVAV